MIKHGTRMSHLFVEITFTTVLCLNLTAASVDQNGRDGFYSNFVKIHGSMSLPDKVRNPTKSQ